MPRRSRQFQEEAVRFLRNTNKGADWQEVQDYKMKKLKRPQGKKPLEELGGFSGGRAETRGKAGGGYQMTLCRDRDCFDGDGETTVRGPKEEKKRYGEAGRGRGSRQKAVTPRGTKLET